MSRLKGGMYSLTPHTAMFGHKTVGLGLGDWENRRKINPDSPAVF